MRSPSLERELSNFCELNGALLCSSDSDGFLEGELESGVSNVGRCIDNKSDAEQLESQSLSCRSFEKE